MAAWGGVACGGLSCCAKFKRFKQGYCISNAEIIIFLRFIS
jgi:hypothetical protein